MCVLHLSRYSLTFGFNVLFREASRDPGGYKERYLLQISDIKWINYTAYWAVPLDLLIVDATRECVQIRCEIRDTAAELTQQQSQKELAAKQPPCSEKETQLKLERVNAIELNNYFYLPLSD